MLSLIPRLPLYWTFRRFGWPRMLPFSIVVSVSFRCNSKCKTCDVWRKPNDDMTVEEWDRVFATMGPGPLYITFTGGEPFLRSDTADMVLSACRHCRPAVVTVPTNGILTRRIVDQVDRICAGAPHTKIGINLSLDGIGEEHDEIRKVKPGETLRVEVEILPTSVLLSKGHRLRLDIQPWDDEEGTFFAHDNKVHWRGENSIRMGGEHASYLLLPVIPPP